MQAANQPFELVYGTLFPRDPGVKKPGYIVTGKAEFRTPVWNSFGEVLTVNGGGLVIRSKEPAPMGTVLEIRFSFQGHPAEIQAKARVVRSERNMMEIAFLEETQDIQELNQWLEARFAAWLRDVA